MKSRLDSKLGDCAVVDDDFDVSPLKVKATMDNTVKVRKRIHRRLPSQQKSCLLVLNRKFGASKQAKAQQVTKKAGNGEMRIRTMSTGSIKTEFIEASRPLSEL